MEHEEYLSDASLIEDDEEPSQNRIGANAP